MMQLPNNHGHDDPHKDWHFATWKIIPFKFKEIALFGFLSVEYFSETIKTDEIRPQTLHRTQQNQFQEEKETSKLDQDKNYMYIPARIRT